MCVCRIPDPPTSADVVELYSKIFTDFRGLAKMKKHLLLDDARSAHLELIFRSGANLKTKITCRFCSQEKIRFFTILAHGKITRSATCCGKATCMERLVASLDADSVGVLYPIGLPTLLLVEPGREAEELIRLLIFATGLPGSFSPLSVYRFLVANYSFSTEQPIIPDLAAGVKEYYETTAIAV